MTPGRRAARPPGACPGRGIRATSCSAGEDLRRRIRRAGPIAVEEVLRLIEQAAIALDRDPDVVAKTMMVSIIVKPRVFPTLIIGRIIQHKHIEKQAIRGAKESR